MKNVSSAGDGCKAVRPCRSTFKITRRPLRARAASSDPDARSGLGIPTSGGTQGPRRGRLLAPRIEAEPLRQVLSDPLVVCAVLGLDPGARPQSGGLLIHCPWHEDGSPSCSVTQGGDGTLRVKCFGCDQGADVFGLIARVHGLDTATQFPRVLTKAQGIADSITAIPPGTSEVTSQPQLPAPRSGAASSFAAALLAGNPLHRVPDACAYLEGRGVLDQAAEEGWGALPGYAPEAIARLNALYVDLGAETWHQSGFAHAQGGLLWPEHRLLIPWRDEAGRITLQRRLLRAPVGNEPKYVFPRESAPASPYGIERLVEDASGADVVWVEGAVDVLAYRDLARREGRNPIVLGLPGVANGRMAWAERMAGRTCFLAFDADDAGDLAAARMATLLFKAGAARVLRARPNGAKDWAEVLARRAP